MAQENSSLPVMFPTPDKAQLILDMSGITQIAILTDAQKASVKSAFQNKAYDMASEFIWKRSVTRLKEVLAGFEIEFLSDMLGRSDVTPYDSLDTILNDYNVIKLAEQLGMISSGAAMHLRQSSEMLQYYFSSNAQEDKAQMSEIDSIQIINSCVKYVLNVPNISLNFKFRELRNKILTQEITDDDQDLEALYSSSIFVIRTILTLLTKAVKRSQGVELDCVTHNFSIMVPYMWERLSSEDRWRVGVSYRDAVTEGNDKAAKAVKSALLKVKGFDYVPENLRSNTFKMAAQHLIEVHNGYNNFYNEPRAIKELERLGTVIPDPAFAICMRAYLLVYTGNFYSVSHDAVPIAYTQLEGVSKDKWLLFFDEILPHDYDLLSNLGETRPIKRMSSLISKLGLDNLECKTKVGSYLFNSCKQEASQNIRYYQEGHLK